MRKRTVYEAEKKNATKIKSPFIKYAVTTIAVILLLSVTFCLMMFKTNILFDVDMTSTSKSSVVFQRTSMDTIIAEVEKEENSVAGVNTGGNNGTGTGAGGVSQTPNLPGLNPNFTDKMDVPDPGTPIQLKDGSSVERASTDSWTMEMTVLKYRSKSSIITGRINDLQAKATSTNIGAENSLLTFDIDGATYYAVAMIDGFTKPYGAYQVVLDDGTVFNVVAIDVKSQNDSTSTAYGHGYVKNGKVNLSCVEFSDASTSQMSIAHNSAKDYSNAPPLAGHYTKSIHYLGQLI